MKQSDIRSVQVIWCDDVRQEVGNKASYMGVYHQMLVPSALPAVLPKLCAVISITTPVSRPFQALHVRLILSDKPDSPVVQIDTDPAEVQANLRPPEPRAEGGAASSRPAAAIGVTSVLSVGNLELTAATEWLQVVVDVGDEVLESLKLRVSTPERLQPQT